jgi:predicted nucleic acid-binding protein
VAVALLDSSAVVGYLDGDDALHHDAARAIETTVASGHTLAVSAVTWSELLHGALLGYYPEDAVREFAEDFGIRILSVDRTTAEHSAQLQAAYRAGARRRQERKLRTPDALILATYLQYDDIEQVICGDAKWANVPGIDADALTMLRTR